MGTWRTERGLLAAILGLGALVFLPALRTPFFLDDYLHRAMMSGTFPGRHGPFELYDFVTDENRAEMLARGVLPWWTDPGIRIRFLRPLASALVWADHRVFGEQPLPMHLHSFVWWTLVVLAAHALYRRILRGRPLLVATAAFALAPCHALPLAWLANRETLLALAFGAWGLVFHVRADEERRRGRRLLAATVAYALSFAFAGEYALCVGGYVLAFAALRRGWPALRRAIFVLPFAVPALVYLVLRSRLGYGTAGSGFYTDPFGDPLGFLVRAPWRFTALVAESWLTWDVTGAFGSVRAWIALGVLLAASLLTGPVRRLLAKEEHASLRWLVLGSFGAMVPILAAVPSMRLLGATTLGIAPVAACLVEKAWFSDRGAERDRVVQITWFAALLLGFTQLVHGPAMAWLLANKYRDDARAFEAGVAELRRISGDPEHANVGIVRGLAGTFFAPFAIDPKGTIPARWCVAAHVGHVLALRKDERTFELVSGRDSAVVPAGDGNLFRADVAALRPGTSYRTSCFDVTVLDATERGPRVVRISVREPMSAITWVEEGRGTWRAAELPAIGFGTPFDP